MPQPPGQSAQRATHVRTMYALPLAPRSHQSALTRATRARGTHTTRNQSHSTQPRRQADVERGTVQYGSLSLLTTHVTPSTAPPPPPDVAQTYALCALSALASVAGAAALALSAIIARTTAATKMSTATAKIMKAAPAS